MESEGGLSASKRSAGGGRGERTSSETQGFFVAKVGNERDGTAPKYHCGVYAVLYLSKTANNPNRLFFGYPFFKIRLNHCENSSYGWTNMQPSLLVLLMSSVLKKTQRI